MKRRKPRCEVHYRTVRVRAKALWTRSAAVAAGLGQWHIVWHYATNNGVRKMPPQPIGVNCWEHLDIHLSVPEYARGYELIPVRPGGGDTIYCPRQHFDYGTELHGQLRIPGWSDT